MTGKVILLGDNIDTDQLAPGRYMRGGIAEIAAHCLEDIRPGFADLVQPGDVLVTGRNFGTGSSREQAAEALLHLQITGVVALSFAGIFYRNAINLGLPVLVISDLTGIEGGDVASLDPWDGSLILPEKGTKIPLEPIPDNLTALLRDGGLVPHLKKRFAAERAEGNRS